MTTLETSSQSGFSHATSVSSRLSAFQQDKPSLPGRGVQFNVIQRGLMEDVEVEVFSQGMNRHDTPDMREIASLIFEVEQVLAVDAEETSLSGFEADLAASGTSTSASTEPAESAPQGETLDEMIASFESTHPPEPEPVPFPEDDPLLKSIPITMPGGEQIMMPALEGTRSPADVKEMRAELKKHGMCDALIEKVVNAGFTNKDLDSLKAKSRGSKSTRADVAPGLPPMLHPACGASMTIIK